MIERGGMVPNDLELKDLAEYTRRLEKKIRWWNHVGSKRKRPWSRFRELVLDANKDR